METEKKDFLSWYLKNNIVSKAEYEKLEKDISKGIRIDFWDKLTPEQKHDLSTGSQEALRNVQKPKTPTPKRTVKTIRREPIYKDDPINQTRLIQEYLQAVEAVKKNKKLKTEEKLEKLLTPLVELSKIVFPTNYASHLTFINEDIDLKNELDLDNLKGNPKKYSIMKDTELRELGLLRAGSKNIDLSDQYLMYLAYCKQVKPISENEFCREIYPNAKRNDCCSVDDTKNSIGELIEPSTGYSLKDIYEDWLLTLTPEIMKSNDLLDRILVTFTIKRALNRDEKAIDKLYSLFQNTAIAIAVGMAKKRCLERHLPDIRQQAELLLRLHITGFPPLEILKGLKDGNERSFLRIPKHVKSFYVYWLLEYVPKGMKKLVKKINKGSANTLNASFECLFLINPASPIDAEFKWKLTPKAIRMFNSFSFRPSNKTNLYKWLFGTNEPPMKGITSGYMAGRFCQTINEELSRYYKTEMKPKKKEIANNQDYEESIRQQQKDFNSTNNCDASTEDEEVEDKKTDETMGALIEETNEAIRIGLRRMNVCERDIEIVISKLKGDSYTDLGAKNQISRRQVINIFNKYKPSLKSYY